MSPHFKQLGEHWKELSTAVVAVGAALAAVPGLVNKTTSWLQWFKDLPVWLQWMAVVLLVVIAIWLLVSAMARRSTLRRAERFLIETETPEQLIGREKDLRELITTCEKHRLVFLPGDSGSGKTALVRAGLMKTCQASDSTSRLLPVYIDASMLQAWEGGLEPELKRALRLLSEDQLKSLGTVHPDPEQALAEWIESLQRDALRHLLVIIDQFDDYAVRWRDQLIDEFGNVIRPERLKQKNSDWAILAKGITHGRLSVIFVIRDDMQWALSPVRFVDPAEKPPLPRLAAHWVRDLFERITADDGAGETVQDPKYGWHQLSKRLQQDLARDGGTVLAIQLVVAVEGLQHLRSLSMTEFQRQGGLTGMEQLHVKAELEKASQCGGLKLDPLKLLRALEKLLVSEDGLKTGATDQPTLAAELGIDPPLRLKPVLDHLVSQRILRRHITAEGTEQLMLYHDFRARGIREAWIRANGSHELLRHHHSALAEAQTFAQKWRALLSTQDQLFLVWARLRGRIRYGSYRHLAMMSLIRSLPLCLLLVALATGTWQWHLFGQRQQAERCLVFEEEVEPSANELRKWTLLAGLSEQARLHALQIGLKEQPRNFQRRSEWIVLAVIGLDPGGRIQQRIADEIILPVLMESNNREHVQACLAVLWQLDLSQPKSIAAALLERMKLEENSDEFTSMGSLFSTLCEKLEIKSIPPIADALFEGMIIERKGLSHPSLVEAFLVASGKLTAKDAQVYVAALLEHMKSEQEPFIFVRLTTVLSSLSEKLGPKDLQPFAAVLVERMMMEQNESALGEIETAFSIICKKLDDKDLQPLASALLGQMKTESKSIERLRLTKSLLIMSNKLKNDDLQLFAATLTTWMIHEQDRNILLEMGRALKNICHKLEKCSLRPFTAALLERMRHEQDESAFAELAQVMSSMSGELEMEDLRLVVAALQERTIATQDAYTLSLLSSSLSSIGDTLEATNLRPVAAALVERLKVEQDFFELEKLGDSLSALSGKLEVKDLQPIAAILVERMRVEKNGDVIWILGSLLSSISMKLKAEDLRRHASTLVERMKNEQVKYISSGSLTVVCGLKSIWPGMSETLTEEDLRPFAETLTKRMKSEPYIEILTALGDSLSSMSKKLEAGDIRPGATALLERMKDEKNTDDYVLLVTTWLNLHKRLEPQFATRMSDLLNLLQQPIALKAHSVILNHIESYDEVAPAKFNGKVSKLIHWIETTEQGKSLELNLDFRPH